MKFRVIFRKSEAFKIKRRMKAPEKIEFWMNKIPSEILPIKQLVLKHLIYTLMQYFKSDLGGGIKLLTSFFFS